MEKNFKLDDLVMYGNKVSDTSSVTDYFMKPAKITKIYDTAEKYPYQITLLDEDKYNNFSEEELIPMATSEEELGTMLIRNQITDETYKQLIKTLNSPL